MSTTNVFPMTPLPAPGVCSNSCPPWLGPQGDSVTCVPKNPGSAGIKLCGTYLGTGVAQDIVIGFDPDMVIIKANSDTLHSDNWILQSTEMQAQDHVLRPDIGTSRIIMPEFITSFLVPGGGFSLGTGVPPGGSTSLPDANYPGVTYTYYAFKKTPGFFDCGMYVGTAVDPGFHAHNLTVVPELMVTKTYAATRSWLLYHNDMTELNACFLDSPIPTFAPLVSANSGSWGSTKPTEVAFATASYWNFALDYFYFMFASMPGVSKVGSYLSDGSVQIIPTDFIPAQILIKNAFSTSPYGTWRWVDSCNNPVNPATQHFDQCTADPLVATTDIGNFYNDRLEITTIDPEYNRAGDTYVYVILGY